MNTNKFMMEFQSINDKLNTYEIERTNLILKIKAWDKEIRKLEEKSKKETDPIAKSLINTKIVCNKYFIQEINSVFKSTFIKDKKNDKTL